ncbi:MAG: AmmeMemoRadiSam system protein B [Ignavibacteria bacterium]|nr:AmmeMemoRadiSam system protein B [Ignavibacteria bacterium]MBT8382404.1 AmmeMemoRadiSam system protein B [Ignavibacteria bacterium]MBT8393068.1 AmmeMemoRadiSam system protein B [Ignavibacteria bacterium]NNJ53589.1 AmmeMemoRadiSam system protein B [Ignavibacteriaceae bacterium]NNL20196.1 AmmeMemoRadiSam system protein B [Ignavibacteriaceae bacterium]
MKNVRPAQVAGYFYPADPEKLSMDISLLLDKNKSEHHVKKVFGIVSPHAGYVYSGGTASHAYNLLKGKTYKSVVVISPSHSEYFPGVSVFEGDAYETPLGVLEVDKEFTEKMTKNSSIIFSGFEGHRKEHALEVQLPFLQSVLQNFKIVPLVMGDQTKAIVDALSTKLAEICDDETLIVASSDMSHFHSKTDADKLDSIVESRINNFDFESLQEDLEFNNCEACGGGPIVVLLKAASLKNIKHSKVLHRSDSGDVTGDSDGVVGYLSAVIYSD